MICIIPWYCQQTSKTDYYAANGIFCHFERYTPPLFFWGNGAALVLASYLARSQVLIARCATLHQPEITLKLQVRSVGDTEGDLDFQTGFFYHIWISIASAESELICLELDLPSFDRWNHIYWSIHPSHRLSLTILKMPCRLRFSLARALSGLAELKS